MEKTKVEKFLKRFIVVMLTILLVAFVAYPLSLRPVATQITQAALDKAEVETSMTPGEGKTGWYPFFSELTKISFGKYWEPWLGPYCGVVSGWHFGKKTITATVSYPALPLLNITVSTPQLYTVQHPRPKG